MIFKNLRKCRFKYYHCSKAYFHRYRHQKRKDEIRPFLILAFLQPTTVDKESKRSAYYQITDTIDIVGVNKDVIRIIKNK